MPSPGNPDDAPTQDATTGLRADPDATLPAGLGADDRGLGVVDPEVYAERMVLSQGGMGRIVAAIDLRLGRRVALKELRDDSADARARFAREALLTARLEHPSIVAVHEAGRWPGGEPFYAMRLVPGRSFDRVIAEARTFEARLALIPHVLAVADALAYAHRERVIHRDLKPHNVMVGEFGETVVIDWGLAKDLAAPSSGRERDAGVARVAAAADATVAGEVLGTPTYMSPEQAEGRPVDERADVYAIGAILYHLLTGSLPYVAADGRAVLEAVRRGPPAPVTAWAPDTPRELIAILDRAMARAPADRYPTARELADDLRRFQSGQLVGAHRYTPGELVRRWLRRNRGMVAIGALALATLLVVGTVSVVWIVRAEGRAQDQRRTAERSRDAAEDLMAFFLVDLKARLQTLGRLDVLETATDRAIEYYAALGPPRDSRERLSRSNAFSNVGDVLLEQGRPADALAQYRAALALAEDGARLDPTSTAFRHRIPAVRLEIAQVLLAQGDAAAALAENRAARAQLIALIAELPDPQPVQRDLATAEARIGDILLDQGDATTALAAYRAALAAWNHVAGDGPVTQEQFIGRIKIGDVLSHQGNASDAIVEYRAALALADARVAANPVDARRQRDRALATSKVGDALVLHGDTDGALAAHQTALDVVRTLAANDPGSADRQHDLAIAIERVASLRLLLGDTDAAIAELNAALHIYEALAARDATAAERQRELSISHSQIGRALMSRGDLAGALASYRKSLAIAQALAERDPTNPTWQLDLALSHGEVGEALLEQRDVTGALAAFRAAHAITTVLAARTPDDLEARRHVSITHTQLGDALLASGELTAAMTEFRAAAALSEQLAATDAANVDAQTAVALDRERIGEVLIAQGDADGALAELTEALAIRARRVAEDPANVVGQRDLAGAHALVGNAHRARGDAAAARASYRTAIAGFEALVALDPANATWKADLEHARRSLAALGKQ